MTPEQAKALCELAHEGQYRRAIDVDGEDNPYLVEVLNNANPDDDDYICKDGTFIKGINSVTWTVLVSYSSHPIAVADLLTTDEEKVVGYLHDVIEDTDYTLTDSYWKNMFTPDLDVIDLPDSVYNALLLLTKEPGQNYQDYIVNISSDKLATKVKLADIYHNRSCNPSEQAKKKYLKAIPVLLKAL